MGALRRSGVKKLHLWVGFLVCFGWCANGLAGHISEAGKNIAFLGFTETSRTVYMQKMLRELDAPQDDVNRVAEYLSTTSSEGLAWAENRFQSYGGNHGLDTAAVAIHLANGRYVGAPMIFDRRAAQDSALFVSALAFPFPNPNFADVPTTIAEAIRRGVLKPEELEVAKGYIQQAIKTDNVFQDNTFSAGTTALIYLYFDVRFDKDLLDALVRTPNLQDAAFGMLSRATGKEFSDYSVALIKEVASAEAPSDKIVWGALLLLQMEAAKNPEMLAFARDVLLEKPGNFISHLEAVAYIFSPTFQFEHDADQNMLGTTRSAVERRLKFFNQLFP